MLEELCKDYRSNLEDRTKNGRQFSLKALFMLYRGQISIMRVSLSMNSVSRVDDDPFHQCYRL